MSGTPPRPSSPPTCQRPKDRHMHSSRDPALPGAPSARYSLVFDKTGGSASRGADKLTSPARTTNSRSTDSAEATALPEPHHKGELDAAHLERQGLKITNARLRRYTKSADATTAQNNQAFLRGRVAARDAALFRTPMAPSIQAGHKGSVQEHHVSRADEKEMDCLSTRATASRSSLRALAITLG